MEADQRFEGMYRVINVEGWKDKVNDHMQGKQIYKFLICIIRIHNLLSIFKDINFSLNTTNTQIIFFIS